MAGFIYYVPGNSPPNQQSLEALGFPHAVIAALPGGETGRGPDDQPGRLFGLSPSPCGGGESAHVKYDIENQDWRECCDGKWWLGWDSKHPPRPIDLQRRRVVTGHNVTLADGSDWTMPVLKRLNGSPGVPSVISLTPSGELSYTKPAEPYARMWALLHKIMAGSQSAGEQVTDNDIFNLIADVLGVNYRVSKWELSALEVLDEENLRSLFAATCDMNAAEVADAG